MNETFLLHVLQILREQSHRHSRKIVYESYIDFTKYNKLEIFNQTEIQIHCEIIQSDFDEIGSLVKNGYIDKTILLDLYSDTIRRSWISLEKYIFQKRLERHLTQDHPNFHEFMHCFEWLANLAKSFRDKQGLIEPTFTDFRNTMEIKNEELKK